MRQGSIRPAYPRLFVERRRMASRRASSVSSPVAIPDDGGPSEEQLADYWESWNTYSVENPVVTTLSNGFGWSGSWVIGDEVRENASDDFESYTAENPVSSTLNGGTGWASAFVIVNKV